MGSGEITKERTKKRIYYLQIANIITTVLSVVNLSLDFEGQSRNFRFIVDCADFAFFTVMMILLIIRIVLEQKNKGELKKNTIMDIIIISICFIGIIYEAAVASSFNEFLSA